MNRDEMKIPLIEYFASFEGEGLMVGTPTIFVRVYGCPVKCKWCDTPESWELASLGQDYSIQEILDIVNKLSSENGGIKRVSITGGEPLLYPQEILELTKVLQNHDYYVNLETSGTLFNFPVFKQFNTLSMDIKTPSSGVVLTQDMIKSITEGYFKSNLYLKVVISSQEDLDWLEQTFPKILTSDSTCKPLSLTPCVPPDVLYSLEDQENGTDKADIIGVARQGKSIMDLVWRWNKSYNIVVIPQIHKIYSFQ